MSMKLDPERLHGLRDVLNKSEELVIAFIGQTGLLKQTHEEATAEIAKAKEADVRRLGFLLDELKDRLDRHEWADSKRALSVDYLRRCIDHLAARTGEQLPKE